MTSRDRAQGIGPGALLISAGRAAAAVNLALAAAMLVPAGVDWLDGGADARAFVFAAALVGFIAVGVLLLPIPERRQSENRVALLSLSLIWVSASFSAAAPLCFGSLGLSLADGVFEAASGLTTTGSTVLSGLDDMPHAILLWRSLTQWIGGVGIVAMALVVMPLIGAGGMQIFKLESSDRQGRVLPQFAAFARALVAIYVTLSFACMAGYVAAGMSPFDALNHAMTTVSSGGYSTHDASMGAFYDKPLILWIGTIFMIMAGLPFGVYVALVVNRGSGRWRDPQIPWFLAICAVSSVVIAALLAAHHEEPFHTAITHTAFNVVSVITTTGFAAGDYTHWGAMPVGLFFLLTFLGGCAGSTAGGIKTYRLLIMADVIHIAARKMASPSAIIPPRYAGRKLEPEVAVSVLVFLAAFFAVLALLTLALAATGLDFDTAYTGAQTALTNVGPGLGPVIGPSGNFSSLPDAAKWLLAGGMILGRLEIMAVLALLSRGFWRQ